MTTFKGKIDIEAVDIPTMANMSDDEFRQFVKGDGLFWIDHHDILRSTPAEYPLATRKSQLDILIETLTEYRDRMRDENSYR
ncbi:hypothetical protein IM543_21675 [Massilia sp. UMI-21]|nr:hypothetical protein IM543_21675 [Massilia sp. UMI-21]